MIPFDPRTIEEHRRRYPAAIAQAVDVEAILMGGEALPAEKPEHLFDIDGGLRLVIWMEFRTCLVHGRHRFARFSAGIREGTPLGDATRAYERSGQPHAPLIAQFLGTAHLTFLSIAGVEFEEIEFLGFPKAPDGTSGNAQFQCALDQDYSHGFELGEIDLAAARRPPPEGGGD